MTSYRATPSTAFDLGKASSPGGKQQRQLLDFLVRATRTLNPVGENCSVRCPLVAGGHALSWRARRCRQSTATALHRSTWIVTPKLSSAANQARLRVALSSRGSSTSVSVCCRYPGGGGQPLDGGLPPAWFARRDADFHDLPVGNRLRLPPAASTSLQSKWAPDAVHGALGVAPGRGGGADVNGPGSAAARRRAACRGFFRPRCRWGMVAPEPVAS